MVSVFVPKIKQVTVSRDGSDVVLVVNGQRVTELPWDAALLVAKAIIIQARRIEEQVKAPQTVIDQAILMRKGIPLGLTSNPKIIDEAKKEAGFNSKLRRYIPGTIESREIFGKPVLIKHKPKQEEADGLRENDR